MSGITSTEVSLPQQTHEHTLKINNFRRFTNTQSLDPIPEFRSNPTEIFPGKKVVFVIKVLRNGYNMKRVPDVTQRDKFFSVKLEAGEGVDPPRLAGKVEINLGGSSQSFSFGDLFDGKYLEFDVTNRNLVLKPGKVENIMMLSNLAGNPPHYYCTQFYTNPDFAARLVHMKLTEAAARKDALEIKFTLFTPTLSSRYLIDQTTRIMKDESTADLKISCGERDNKKVFNVHKNFFCASSPVFRAAIESDMLEGRTKEIYIEEVEEKLRELSTWP